MMQVPRGVSIGEVTVKTDRIAWNTTKVRRGCCCVEPAFHFSEWDGVHCY